MENEVKKKKNFTVLLCVIVLLIGIVSGVLVDKYLFNTNIQNDSLKNEVNNDSNDLIIVRGEIEKVFDFMFVFERTLSYEGLCSLWSGDYVDTIRIAKSKNIFDGWAPILMKCLYGQDFSASFNDVYGVKYFGDDRLTQVYNSYFDSLLPFEKIDIDYYQRIVEYAKADDYLGAYSFEDAEKAKYVIENYSDYYQLYLTGDGGGAYFGPYDYSIDNVRKDGKFYLADINLYEGGDVLETQTLKLEYIDNHFKFYPLYFESMQ